MVQIAIPDALYQRLEMLAQIQGVPVEALVQDTLENVGMVTTLLSSQEEDQIFDQLERIAKQNSQIATGDWSKIVSELRD